MFVSNCEVAFQVKAFHGSLLLSDVIKEREAQIEHKRQVEALKKVQDAAFFEMQVKAIEVSPASRKSSTPLQSNFPC